MRLSPPVLAALIAPLAACRQPADTPKAEAPQSEAAAPAAASVVYGCLDGRTVQAAYPDNETAKVTIDGRTATLKIARSGSGARYVGEGLQWWTRGMTEGLIAPLAPGEEIAGAEGTYCSTTPLPAVEPPAPGSPGGLPDDRTSVSEAPFPPTSAQGAADVVQTYYARIGQKAYGEAWKLWSDGGRASGVTRDAFAKSFGRYAAYNAQVGAPGVIEGAAGSLYVETPVVVYGRMMNGAALHQSGKVTLRRVNDVDGSTAEQRLWRIAKIELKP